MNGDKGLIRAAVKAYREELFAAKIYEELSHLYSGDEELSSRLAAIASMEERHAGFWRTFLARRGVDVGNMGPGRMRIWLVKALSKLFGPGLVLKMLESGEGDATMLYGEMLEHGGLGEDEKEGIRRILEDELVHEHELEEESSRFKDFLDHVRDAVLGMSDGLVEVLSVSAGLAGAYGDPFHVAVGGAIVGIGGALSMGIGAFTSVRAQSQVRLSLLNRIKLASRYAAGVLRNRVAGYMSRRGISRDVAERIAAEAAENPELMSSIVAGEEYGLSEAAVENPAKAGIYTGVFYALGAVVPLLPYFAQVRLGLAVPLSFVLAALMLAATGFIIAISAGLNYKAKMAELVAAGLGSALLTFAIGRIASSILGINVG